MQHAVQRGPRAGVLAGLLLVGIFFVDYGPATNLTTIARWFALEGNAWSKLIGAVLLIALGTLCGGLFGLVVRRQSLSPVQSVLDGLLTGLYWWAVLVLHLSLVVRHIQQSFYGVLFWLMTSLLYGLALGSLYGRFQRPHRQRGSRDHGNRRQFPGRVADPPGALPGPRTGECFAQACELLLETLIPRELSLARQRVRLVQIGEMAGPTISLAAAALRTSELEILGAGSGIVPKAIAEGMQQVWEWIRAGKLQADIEQVPLRDVERAWKHTDVHGKRIVIVP